MASGRSRPRGSLFSSIDCDKDDRISRAELRAAIQQGLIADTRNVPNEIWDRARTRNELAARICQEAGLSRTMGDPLESTNSHPASIGLSRINETMDFDDLASPIRSTHGKRRVPDSLVGSANELRRSVSAVLGEAGEMLRTRSSSPSRTQSLTSLHGLVQKVASQTQLLCHSVPSSAMPRRTHSPMQSHTSSMQNLPVMSPQRDSLARSSSAMCLGATEPLAMLSTTKVHQPYRPGPSRSARSPSRSVEVPACSASGQGSVTLPVSIMSLSAVPQASPAWSETVQAPLVPANVASTQAELDAFVHRHTVGRLPEEDQLDALEEALVAVFPHQQDQGMMPDFPHGLPSQAPLVPWAAPVPAAAQPEARPMVGRASLPVPPPMVGRASLPVPQAAPVPLGPQGTRPPVVQAQSELNRASDDNIAADYAAAAFKAQAAQLLLGSLQQATLRRVAGTFRTWWRSTANSSALHGNSQAAERVHTALSALAASRPPPKAPEPPPHTRHEQRDSLFSLIDANKDGVIDRNELLAALQAGLLERGRMLFKDGQPLPDEVPADLIRDIAAVVQMSRLSTAAPSAGAEEVAGSAAFAPTTSQRKSKRLNEASFNSFQSTRASLPGTTESSLLSRSSREFTPTFMALGDTQGVRFGSATNIPQTEPAQESEENDFATAASRRSRLSTARSEFWDNEFGSSDEDESEDCPNDTGLSNGRQPDTNQSGPNQRFDTEGSSSNRSGRAMSLQETGAAPELAPVQEHLSDNFTVNDVSKRKTMAAKALGVSNMAGRKTVAGAYRNCARTMHPDKGGQKEDFQVLQEAYAKLLSDR